MGSRKPTQEKQSRRAVYNRKLPSVNETIFPIRFPEGEKEAERRKISLVILDCGGVVRSTKHALLKPVEEALRETGIDPGRLGLTTGQFHRLRQNKPFQTSSSPRETIAALWAFYRASKKEPGISLERILRQPDATVRFRKLMKNYRIPQSLLNHAETRYHKVHEELLQDLPEVEGAREAIAKLRKLGLPLAIYTNESGPGTIEWLRRHDLHPHFLPIIGKEDVKRQKPHPEGINLILERLRTNHGLNAPRPQVIVIGDSPIDLEAAHKANCISIGVLSGRGLLTELKEAKAHRVFGSLKEFADYMAKNKLSTKEKYLL